VSFYRPGPPTHFAAIPSGIDGIRATLELMRKLVQSWKKDPGVRELALELTRDLPQNDYAGEVRMLHAFVRDRIRYVGDIRNVETLQTPRRTLEAAAGDCDDKSVLLATLLESINHRTRFKAAAFHSPGVYEHVWVQTALGGGWYDLETTKPVPPGWAPPDALPPSILMHN
jgi:transglutaminase-like putative cysteine protease